MYFRQSSVSIIAVLSFGITLLWGGGIFVALHTIGSIDGESILGDILALCRIQAAALA